MNRVLLPLVLLLAGALSAAAQVSVELVLDQEQFLPGEKMNAAVRITNRSGQTLHLGAEEDWLVFSVEGRDGAVLPKAGEVPVQGEFELPTSKVATKRVDLAPYFQITTAGHYSVTATVKLKQWSSEKASEPKGFDIVPGARMWQQEFGLPGTGANGVPELRKYMLQQVSSIKGGLRLYLRVTDTAETKVFRVVPIGIMLSFGRPEAQVDPKGNLHLLYLNQPHSFSYSVFNPDGDLLLRQTYDFTNTRPRLKMTPADEIAVAGGARRITPNDFPPPPPTETSDQKPAAEPGTNQVTLPK